MQLLRGCPVWRRSSLLGILPSLLFAHIWEKGKVAALLSPLISPPRVHISTTGPILGSSEKFFKNADTWALLQTNKIRIWSKVLVFFKPVQGVPMCSKRWECLGLIEEYGCLVKGPADLQDYVILIPPFQVLEEAIPSLLLESEERTFLSSQEAPNINNYHLSSPCWMLGSMQIKFNLIYTTTL